MDTLVHRFWQRVLADGLCTAGSFYRTLPDGEEAIVDITWNELADNVCRLASVIRALGVSTGDRVVQVSGNRYEWILCDLALQQLRCVDVAVHAALSGPQIAFQIRDSDARLVFLADQQQVEKMDQVSEMLPDELIYVSYDRLQGTIGGKPVRSLSQLSEETGDVSQEDLRVEACDNARADTLATILYTSGTTGNPKGVMLNQGNLTSNAVSSVETFGMHSADSRLCWLPLSHIFARTVDLYTWFVAGNRLMLAKSRETILGDCQRFEPSLISGVPYFYDKLIRTLQEEGHENDSTALRKKLGGGIRSCGSGGAALPNYVAEYFFANGVPLLQGYGLTESSPVITMSTETAYKIGSSGKAIPDVEIRIADDGEVLTRGPHVMAGYWKLPDATAATLQDGWLHTGDFGELDDEGYLFITGRKKELIVLASGKNIAPVPLEACLTEEPLIEQALIIGNDRNYLTALIVLNRQLLGERLTQLGIEVPIEEMRTHKLVLDLYREVIDQRLSDAAAYEQVGKFSLLDCPFSIEREELTPTLKLRREVITGRRADLVESMYRN